MDNEVITDLRKVKDGECWQDERGDVYRWRLPGQLRTHFQTWDGQSWVLAEWAGYGALRRCPDPSKPEWLTRLEVLIWALEHPGRELEDAGGTLRRAVEDGGMIFLQMCQGGVWSSCSAWKTTVPRRPVTGTWGDE